MAKENREKQLRNFAIADLTSDMLKSIVWVFIVFGVLYIAGCYTLSMGLVQLQTATDTEYIIDQNNAIMLNLGMEEDLLWLQEKHQEDYDRLDELNDNYSRAIENNGEKLTMFGIIALEVYIIGVIIWVYLVGANKKYGFTEYEVENYFREKKKRTKY